MAEATQLLLLLPQVVVDIAVDDFVVVVNVRHYFFFILMMFVRGRLSGFCLRCRRLLMLLFLGNIKLLLLISS